MEKNLNKIREELKDMKIYNRATEADFSFSPCGFILGNPGSGVEFVSKVDVLSAFAYASDEQSTWYTLLKDDKKAVFEIVGHCVRKKLNNQINK